MRHFSFLFVMMALVAGLGLEAQARGGRGGFHKKIMKQLDLTDQQKKKLSKMREENKESFKALREIKKEKKEKLKMAFESGASDTELLSIHNALMDARNKMGEARFKKMLEVRKILTKEQRQKFQELRAEMREKRRGRRGSWRSWNGEE